MLKTIKILVSGLIAGILSGLLGIGGGIVLVPIMTSILGLKQHNAAATSLAVIIPTAIAGSIMYGSHGNIDYFVALNLIVGSVIGASIGSRMLKKISANNLKMLFGVLLVIVGIRMMLG